MVWKQSHNHEHVNGHTWAWEQQTYMNIFAILRIIAWSHAYACPFEGWLAVRVALGEIALAGSRHLRSALAAASVLFEHAVVQKKPHCTGVSSQYVK